MKTMIAFALASTTLARSFMSDTAETVLVNGENGPMRVNKSDYDADQSESGDKKYTLHKETKAEKAEGINAEQPTGNTMTTLAPGVTVPPAPSAPNITDENGKNIAIPPQNPSPGQRFVSKGKGNKYVITDASGNALEGDGIEAKGYATENDAWAAIMALPAASAT